MKLTPLDTEGELNSDFIWYNTYASVCVNILIKIIFGNVSPPQWYDGRMLASNVVDHGFVPF
jgi:hypothetical protein